MIAHNFPLSTRRHRHEDPTGFLTVGDDPEFFPFMFYRHLLGVEVAWDRKVNDKARRFKLRYNGVEAVYTYERSSRTALMDRNLVARFDGLRHPDPEIYTAPNGKTFRTLKAACVDYRLSSSY